MCSRLSPFAAIEAIGGSFHVLISEEIERRRIGVSLNKQPEYLRWAFIDIAYLANLVDIKRKPNNLFSWGLIWDYFNVLSCAFSHNPN